MVDHKSQARIYGVLHRPLQQQLLSESAVAGDIGEVVAGRLPGRQSDSDITVFDGTGMALEDAVVVHLAYHMACERGQVIDFQRWENGKSGNSGDNIWTGVRGIVGFG